MPAAPAESSDQAAAHALASVYALLLELAEKKAEATGQVASAEVARRGGVDAEPRPV